jgi:hypothetical protein
MAKTRHRLWGNIVGIRAEEPLNRGRRGRPRPRRRRRRRRSSSSSSALAGGHWRRRAGCAPPRLRAPAARARGRALARHAPSVPAPPRSLPPRRAGGPRGCARARGRLRGAASVLRLLPPAGAVGGSGEAAAAHAGRRAAGGSGGAPRACAGPWGGGRRGRHRGRGGGRLLLGTRRLRAAGRGALALAPRGAARGARRRGRRGARR